MESLIILLLIIILFVIIGLKNGIYARLIIFEKEIKELRRQLTAAERKEEKPIHTATTTAVTPKALPQITERPPQLQKIQTVTPVPVQPEKIVMPPPPGAAPVQPKPGFFERNPDFEKFVGENLISKIGIAILVFGIGFFVKYAIDNDWIGSVGRVAIGLICGAILVSVAHYLRNGYKAFSSVLIGGGIAVFYFTISLAFHDYNLFSQPVAFIIMVIITCFAVALSVLYDRQELAVIALLGGFVAPFLVSKGSGNYIALFIYLIILNSGLLVIALKKAWRVLNLLAFLFTAVLLASWAVLLSYEEPVIVYRNGFAFATIFYIIFFIINIIHNIRENKKFIASDFGILLLNTCLYFAAGLYFLHSMGASEYRGVFCMSLGVFNLAASYFLLRKSKLDTNILYLLIGITLTFISLTAPIQLQGNHITLFWASEAVLLYWLYQKSNIRIIQFSSVIVWIAMLISLLMDTFAIYSYDSNKLPVIFNKGFLTIIFGAFSSYLLFILRSKDAPTDKSLSLSLIPVKSVFRIAGIILLFTAGYFEIDHQFTQTYPQTNIGSLYLILYTLAFIATIISVSYRFTSLKYNTKVISALVAGAILIYLSQAGFSFSVQQDILAQGRHNLHFTAHWLSAGIIAVLLFQMIRFYRSVNNDRSDWLTWVICAVILIFLTVETNLLINNIFYSGEGSLSSIQRIFIKAGWPILWGLSSFGFMYIGMRNKFRTMRIISLTLFTVTLVKLFTYDIVDIPASGKIAAFCCLGILLLLISFMYQRLKKIVVDEEGNAK